jgi:hypothetical protein
MQALGSHHIILEPVKKDEHISSSLKPKILQNNYNNKKKQTVPVCLHDAQELEMGARCVKSLFNIKMTIQYLCPKELSLKWKSRSCSIGVHHGRVHIEVKLHTKFQHRSLPASTLPEYGILGRRNHI